MPSGASPRPTKSSAARTFSAAAMRFATLGQTPSFSSAAFPYIPAGTAAGSANRQLPAPSAAGQEEHGGIGHREPPIAKRRGQGETGRDRQRDRAAGRGDQHKRVTEQIAATPGSH